jgi:hypothetical protein
MAGSRALRSLCPPSPRARSHFLLELVFSQGTIRRLKTLIQYTSLAVVTTALFCGCGQGKSKVDSADLKAFDSAPAELKDLWLQSQSAAGTNDYLQATLVLRALMQRELSPGQRAVVETTTGTYEAKLSRAAARGDAEAKKALDTIRSIDAQPGR